MLPIVRNSRLLTLVQLDLSDPIGRCLGHCDRFGDGGVNAGADVNADLLGPRLGMLFALKSLDMAVALLFWELVKSLSNSPKLPRPVREIAILVTGAHFHSAYEIY